MTKLGKHIHYIYVIRSSKRRHFHFSAILHESRLHHDTTVVTCAIVVDNLQEVQNISHNAPRSRWRHLVAASELLSTKWCIAIPYPLGPNVNSWEALGASREPTFSVNVTFVGTMCRLSIPLASPNFSCFLRPFLWFLVLSHFYRRYGPL